jgi:uncharacterized protein (TIGR02466 family)
LGKIIDLFPIPLYVTDIGTDYDTDFIWDEQYYRLPNDHVSITNEYDLLDRPQLKSLKEAILKEVDNFLVDMCKFQDDLEWKIISSWAVKHNKDDYHHMHWHPNSMWSGVYYVHIPEESGWIQFFKDTKPTLSLGMSEYTPWNSHYVEFMPKSGDLIMFPSTLTHNVVNNESEDKRLSIAFNIWPIGMVGSDRDRIERIRFK